MSSHGWTNQETWAVNNWYGEYLSEHFAERTCDAEDVKDFVKMIILKDNIHGITRELLLLSLNRIDWNELADAYKPELEFLYDEF